MEDYRVVYRVRSTRTKRDSALRRAADIAVVLILCAALVVFLFKVLLVPLRMENSPVAELDKGDVVLVDRFSKYLSDYSVGDIVCIDTEEGPAVLRIAAKGGSSYIVTGGRAYLDDALIDESAYSGSWPEEAELSFTVPENELLLLPDQREDVTELSAHSYKYSEIGGEVRIRISPLSKFALFI